MQQLDRPAPEAPSADAALIPASGLTLEHHGALCIDRAALSILHQLRNIADDLPRDRAGLRLHGIGALQPLLSSDGALGSLVSARLGAATRAVRAIMFDKTAGANWSLGWHQDRTIVVRERLDVPGFGPWTVKTGMTHVAPPPKIQADMITMRVHLDDVPPDNAPLLIAPASHKLGRIAETDIDTVVGRCGISCCLATAGDVWLYATPILHASAASAGTRRRVLQIDFAAGDLPGGLQWLGV